jgi:penicillin-binding protein 2
VPQRGRILDRKGRPLAETGSISRVGVVPGKITDEKGLLATLPGLLGMSADDVKAKYADGQPDWFMPVKDLPDQMDPGLIAQLTAIPGVAIQKWPARIYPAGAAAAHITGYLSEVTAEELPDLSKLGYSSGDVIGRGGIEQWAESWLAGKRGGTLALLAQDGSTLRVLGSVPATPGDDVVLTIDLDLQMAADVALGDVQGSAVVLDPSNGEVLAMVSHPSFDPNQFILGVTDEQWAALNDPVRQPLINRATQVGYPTGSTFKVVTASAGMVHLGYDAGSPFDCPGEFTVPGSTQVWHDWVPGGQGQLDLHNAIVRSCNTVFYKMGEDLDNADPMFLPDMARAFGFGTPTGIPELDEIAGIVPDPNWKITNVGDFWATGDAVNLAIGQGFFLASPLQLADAYAAIANGGTLYVPHLLLDVVALDGSIVTSGQVQERGKLPVSPEQLSVITSAMYDVINASNGTATAAFEGEQHQVSGKTGTAETGKVGEDAHAWFAGITPSDGPKMTVITMVEHGKAGSVAAAPVARKIVDAWYSINGG